MIMEFAGTRWITWRGLAGPLTLYNGTTVMVEHGDSVEVWTSPSRIFYLAHRPAPPMRFTPIKKQGSRKAGRE